MTNNEPEEAKNEDIQRLKENDELLLAEENRRNNNINNARRQERGGSNQFQIYNYVYVCIQKENTREIGWQRKEEGKKKKNSKTKSVGEERGM